MAEESVLKAFLIKLGFHVDDESHKRFVGAIRGATLQSQLMAEAIEEAGKKVFEFAKSIDEGLEKLYWSSFRTRTSAENIHAFSFAMGQLGSSAERGAQMLEQVADFQDKYGEGSQALIASLIGEAGAAKDTAGIVEDLGKRWKRMWDESSVARSTALVEGGLFGFSRADIMAMMQGTEEFGRAAHSVLDAFHVDLNKAARGSHEFMNELRGTKNVIDTLFILVADKLNDRLTPQFARFDHFLLANADNIATFIEHMINFFDKLISAVNSVVEKFGGWDTVIKGIIVLKLEMWAFGAAAGLFRMAAAIFAIGQATAGITFLKWLVESGALRLLTGVGLGAYLGLTLGKSSIGSQEQENELLRQQRGGRSAAGTPGEPAIGGGTGTDLLNIEKEHLGQSGPDINGWLNEHHAQINAAQDAWCAAFVNASLESIGVKGTGNNVATSFLSWSKQRQGAPVAGDVMVQARGHAEGEMGGHVGTFTGETRKGPDGFLQYKIRGGNQGPGGRATDDWFNASEVTSTREGPIKGTQGAPASHGADSSANNPSGLEYNAKQPGVLPQQGRFGRFATIEEGIAATARQWMIDQDKHHLMTLRQIIGDPKNGWAPANENDTEGYINKMSAATGVRPDDPFDVHNRELLAKAIMAQSKIEGRNALTPEQVDRGLQMQLDRPITPADTGGGSHVSVNQTTHVTVHAANDPQAVAGAVSGAQSRINEGLVRSTRSAIS